MVLRVVSLFCGKRIQSRWSLKGRKGVLLKLDLEKAYDKVDWSFFDMAMKLKSFGKR